jgi:Spy/CpxP family protein refolding chaperone
MMKRWVFAAVAAALLAPGWAGLPARAQDDDMPPPPERSGEQGDGGARGDRMRERLGLSEEQAGKLKDARREHAATVKPLQEKQKEAVKSLARLLRKKASDDEIGSALQDLASARKAAAAENEKFEAALGSFLTPTQRAKLIVGMTMRRRAGGGRGEREEGPRERRGDEDEGGRGGPRNQGGSDD